MSIRRNTAYNLAGSLLPLVVTLITLPIYINLIGEERFGALAIVLLIIGASGMFDLGLGRATARQIAALRDGTSEVRAQTFWTALTLNAGLAVVGGLIVWPVTAYFFGHMFKAEDVLPSEINGAVIWLVLAVPVAILTATLDGALQGRERFLELNIISLSGAVLSQLAPLAVAIYVDVNLVLLLSAVVFVRLLVMLALFRGCKRQIILGFKPSFHKEQAGTLLRFGGWVSITSFLSIIMVILDRFFIGAMMGAKEVTYYTVPRQLASRTAVISNALVRALFPRFSAASFQEETQLARKALRALVTVLTPITIFSILLIEPFLTWWVGPVLAKEATLVGQIMLLGFWINGFASIPFAQLQARGRPDLVSKCHLLEVLPYLLLLYLGLNYFGLVGAAAAFLIRVSFDFILLAGLAGNLLTVLRLFFIPICLFSASLLIASQSSVGSEEWFIFMFVLILTSTMWAWSSAPDEIRTSILKRLNPFFNS